MRGVRTLIEGPATEPVSLAEAKAQCRVDTSDDDTLLTSLIKASRHYVENYIRRPLIPQTKSVSFNRFHDEMLLSPQLQSVSGVTYVDSEGVTQTLATSIYQVDTDSQPGRIYRAYNQTWPSVRLQPMAVKATVVCGYGDDASDVPEDIRLAILLLVSERYDRREIVSLQSESHEMPFTISALLDPYRLWSAP